MLMLVELVIFLATWFSVSFLLQCWNGLGKEKRRYPPSLPSLPLVGSLPFLRDYKNFAAFFMRKADELGPIFTFRVGNKLVCVLNSKEVIEDALVNHSFAFSGRGSIYVDGIANPNRKGLTMMSTSKEWKRYHQLSLSILKEFGFGVKSTMESRILTELEFLTKFLLEKNGHAFNPKEIIYLSTNNVMTNIIFGHRLDYHLGMTDLLRQIKRMFDSFDMNLDIAPILRFLPFHRDKLRQNLDSQRAILEIFQKKILMISGDRTNDSFLSRYLKHEGPDHDAEQLWFTLRDTVAASTDTTAKTVIWSLIALANNPDIQNRLREEIDAVISRDRLPSVMDQPNLSFVEATCLEVMRWRTLVPLSLPHMTICDTSVGDYFLPAETMVLPNLYAAHMDPKVWKDPETFRPERFLDKEGRVINRESVIPFSLGRRSCLGESLARAEFFLLFVGLVQRFFIRPPEDQDIVEAFPIEPVAMTLTATEFNIRMIARY